ncbi:coiled-coil domain-containing protein 30 isoform X1 [Simochromis diagramma]|uniref:coiled-coil domain-containing protein 30 isoform X1 n=1 Tax=Simochromis diagramma TaxID=43689 RepID=UPI001A7E8D26|nr:coiled-coil domain-containing protein 30 isoform X1 [Simochromis diagramma]XP_039856592.1 coiled-coil domain-containing protein 30 isoform X1 [Simochromis diagramma]XP_039856601.1 coiled-coil domain-containing protein 30 isoform X1 [Simochromis diagramma]
MDQEEQLEEISAWCKEEGLPPDSSKEAQLCLLWHALQRTTSRLSKVTRDLETYRSQHLAEMAEVRKSLEQIRFFTEHKNVLAQEIQDENDHLKEQLRRLISLQDAQISEVAKMLYQQGLTELIHSSPSEQVAYLLVERASLLETSELTDKLTGDGNTANHMGTGAQVKSTGVSQAAHKGAPHHGQSAWKKLFGLKSSQNKHTFIPAEARFLAGQESSLGRECSRLERDLEEGSRRLAMAHNEIRRLTDELESAHLTQRAYEPELQSAQQEVEQLRQEVEKLKKYEMVELRKTKELNDRLDLEIRALRNRVRSLDAEKTSLKQMVVSLQEEAEQLKAALQEELLTKEVPVKQATEMTQSPTAELVQSNKTCRRLQEKLTAERRSLLEKEETIHSLQQQVDCSQTSVDNLVLNINTSEDILQDQMLLKQKKADPYLFVNTQSHDSFVTTDEEPQTIKYEENRPQKECINCQQAMKTLLSSQEECEALKREICETLNCIDEERSKFHEMKQKHKAKLCRAKQKFEDETTWRDEKIKSLERELSLCCHSVAKEKELVISITVENEKLLSERRKLLQQLNEEEHKKKDSCLKASLSKCRVELLELENKKLGNQISQMSNQLAVLEFSLQKTQLLHFAEKLKKMPDDQQVFKSLPQQSSSVISPEQSEAQALLDGTLRGHSKQTDGTCYSRASEIVCQSADMSYLNLTSTQKNHLNRSGPLAALSSLENLPS